MRGRQSVVLGFMLAIIGWLCPLLAGNVAAAAALPYKPEGGDALGVIRDHLPRVVRSRAGGGRWAVTPFWFCYALHDALVKPMP